mgnify:CR=1 FL=1
MILVLITMASYVLVRFIERAAIEVQGEGYYVERTRLRLDAWSMMEVAVAVLADVKEIEGALYSPAQGWQDPLKYSEIQPKEGLKVTFEFLDESAKMGINVVDEGALFLLFDEMGFDINDSQELSDALLDWIDEDDDERLGGAESREYSKGDIEMRASNQPLRSLQELKYVLGFKRHFFDESGIPNANFSMLSEVFTTYNVERINVNSARPLALMTLGGLGELQVKAIYDYLDGVDNVIGTGDDNYFASQEEMMEIVNELDDAIAIDFQISVLTIKVTVQEGGSAYTLVGTLDLNQTASIDATGEEGGSLEYPFLFLELREQPGMNNAESTESPENNDA